MQLSLEIGGEKHMPLYEIKVKLKLQGPLVSNDSSQAVFGLDSTFKRSEDGTPVLDGTLIRGNLRHSWSWLLREAHGAQRTIDIASWLGKESKGGEDGDYAPQRGRLVFDDEWRCLPVSPRANSEPCVLIRIKKDENTETVKNGSLLLIESFFAPGEEILCEGCISASCSIEEKNDLMLWLKKGFKAIQAFGAYKGVGFGKVLSSSVDIASERVVIDLQDKPQVDFPLFLSLSLDRPFCFSRPGADTNNNESEEFVPGAAIIGAIVQKLHFLPHEERKQFSALEECLERGELYCSHAYPRIEAEEEKNLGLARSNILPLSVACLGKNGDTFCDLALSPEDVPMRDHIAPCFQIDWKSTQWNALSKQNNFWPVLESKLVIRTAVNQETRAAFEGKLFSLQSIKTNGRAWLCKIELATTTQSDKNAILRQLIHVLELGLDYLGKTEARASFKILDRGYRDAIPSLVSQCDFSKENLVISLQSPARLIADYSRLRQVHTNGNKELHNLYQASWNSLMEEAILSRIGLAEKEPLVLLRYFAQHSLAGGNYLHRRFKKLDVEEPYLPQLLTKAGSVFVFQVKKELANEVLKVVECWRTFGLPLLPEHKNETWRTTPFLPQNGYGEISVNMELHQRWKFESCS